MEEIMDIINGELKLSLVMGDMNINLLCFQNHRTINEYLDGGFTYGNQNQLEFIQRLQLC